jgi:hypothetical protein
MPRGKEPVDFEALTEGYNQRYGTTYSQTEFLARAYKNKGALLPTAEWLGVSPDPLRRKMAELEIPVRPQTGGYHGGPTLEEKFLKIPREKLAKMTSGEIQMEMGAGHITSVLTLIKKYNVTYRKHKRTYKRDSPIRDAIINLKKSNDQMTVYEIAKKAGCKMNYVWATLRKYREGYYA